MNSIAYLTVALKQSYVVQKLKLDNDWWKNKGKEK